MKKLFIFAAFISTYTFGQSVTIEPSLDNIVSLKKNESGIDHRSNNNLVGIGTYITTEDASAYILTQSNHPLGFATNNGATQMILLTNGNLGIGTTMPTQKLHVVGNAYFATAFNSTGQASAGTLNIGGGSTISKFMEFFFTAQSIVAMNSNACNTQIYTATGLQLGDAVSLNIEGVSSTNLIVGNVRAYNDLLEIKYCNLGNTSTTAQTVNLKVAAIR